MSRRHPLRASSARRMTGLGLAVVHFAAALGLPVPTPAAAGPDVRPAPCRGKACGCSPAARTLGPGCCCSAPVGPAAAKDCCQPVGGKRRACCLPEPVPVAEGSWVLAWDAAGCHGQGLAGVMTHPPAAAPFEPIAVCRELPRDVVPARPQPPASVPVRPPTPPPKHV